MTNANNLVKTTYRATVVTKGKKTETFTNDVNKAALAVQFGGCLYELHGKLYRAVTDEKQARLIGIARKH